MLALVAGIVGVAIGYLVATFLLPGVAATLQGLYGASVPGMLTLRPQWWVTGLGIAVAGTLVSAAQSLWRVWRMPLLAPAQPRAWARASETALRFQAFAALGLFATTIVVGLVGVGAGRGVCHSWRFAAGCCAAAAGGPRALPGSDAEMGISAFVGAMVLGRYTPAASRSFAGSDGIAPGSLGQCRRWHDGIELPPDLYRLAGSAAGRRALCDRA